MENSSLRAGLVKLMEIVEEENAVLADLKIVSHAGFTDRKNQALRQVMAAQRLETNGAWLQAAGPLLKQLSAALKTNASLLRIHIQAVGEISDIFVETFRAAESDGTYARTARSQ